MDSLRSLFGKKKETSVLVTGSLAFDHIMDFPGRFSEQILPDQIHILNVSFLVDKLNKQWGGTAGNIAYNLALLGVPPTILATAGRDFAPYVAHLKRYGVNASRIKLYRQELTSVSFIVTDRDDNQIAGFYGGAMARARGLSVGDVQPRPDLVIISPNDPPAMIKYARECQGLKLPFIFDPGQQVARLGSETIREAVAGSEVLIGNDYEVEMVKRIAKADEHQLLRLTKVLVVTKGKKGSEIVTRKSHYRIPSVKTRKAVDPTGAGDAYRAGIIKGYSCGWEWSRIGRVAALAAVYAVEKHGNQEHFYTPAAFLRRYQENFGNF